jgi:hypothetical protein
LAPCESPDGLFTRNGNGSAVDHEYIVFIMVLHCVGITENNLGPLEEDKVHLLVDDGGRHGVCRVFEVEAESWKERGIRERERENRPDNDRQQRACESAIARQCAFVVGALPVSTNLTRGNAG